MRAKIIDDNHARVTFREGGIRVIMRVEPEHASDHHLFRLQAVLHCFSPFGQELTKMIFADTIQELILMAPSSAKSLFNIK